MVSYAYYYYYYEIKHLHSEGASRLALLVKCYFGNQTTEAEMSGTCMMYGAEETCIQGVTPEGKGPLGRPRRRWKYIQLDKWWALVSMDTKLRLPYSKLFLRNVGTFNRCTVQRPKRRP